MEKRVVFALALSLFILVAFQWLMPQQRPLGPQQSVSTPQEEVAKTETPIVDTKAVSRRDEDVVLPDEKEINFQNDLYTVVFSDVGAGIKKITLNKNPQEGLNIPYDIFDVTDPRTGLCLFVPDEAGTKLNNVKYNSSVAGNKVIFTHNFNDEFVLEKRFIFYNSLYRIDLELTWKNMRTDNIVKQYSLISGSHLSSSRSEDRFLEISASQEGKVVKYRKRNRPFEIRKAGTVSWTMLKNRYFAMIIRPFITPSGCVVRQLEDKTLTTGIEMQPFNLNPNSSVIHTFGLYMGPLSLGLVKKANFGAEEALSSGVFGSISQLLISALKFFHKVSHNWGVAILMLTLLINIVLSPLTRKSYKSMHDMQMLQPKIEKIRQELKSNPQKLQKEIMELYKKHKVNPMGGCLPMLLQMPIFIALYQGLMRSIELRGAHFLWIKDLSIPENIKIPIELPIFGDSLNILPLLMVGAMFFQQRLSTRVTAMSQTDEQRKQQKMMSVMMTVMFGFIFYNFPSGLVLYWLGNTVIMSGYQYFLTRTPR